MLLFVLLIVSVGAFERDVLQSALQSHDGQLKLFSKWMNVEHKDYNAKERAFRFRIFRQHLKAIVAINSAQDKFRVDVNFFAGLTEEEQQQWRGINITEHPAEPASDDLPTNLPTVPSLSWRDEGAVNAAKNQGGCMTCWAFTAVACIEGHYAIKTGRLERFSEKEFADCVYPSQHSCGGRGWYWKAFERVRDEGRLALEKDYPYAQRDGDCRASTKANGMTRANLVRVVRPRKTNNDGSLLAAVNIGPVAIAIEVHNELTFYTTGILTVTDRCGRRSDHAMTVTGYTPQYWEIKNSYGSTWGESGYVKWDRTITNMCGISNWISYPEVEST